MSGKNHLFDGGRHSASQISHLLKEIGGSMQAGLETIKNNSELKGIIEAAAAFGGGLGISKAIKHIANKRKKDKRE